MFIGSPAHGNGPAKVESFAKTNAPTLWEIVGFRTWNGQGSKYPVEGVAMLYAIEAGAVKGNTKIPAGSKIAAWGKVGKCLKTIRWRHAPMVTLPPAAAKLYGI